MIQPVLTFDDVFKGAGHIEEFLLFQFYRDRRVVQMVRNVLHGYDTCLQDI